MCYWILCTQQNNFKLFTNSLGFIHSFIAKQEVFSSLASTSIVAHYYWWKEVKNQNQAGNTNASTSNPATNTITTSSTTL